jgi:hypothetical protein
MSAYTAVETLLTRLRDRWHASGGLEQIDPSEVERIAGRLWLSASELQDLMSRGPGATDLVHERMRALGLSRADVEGIASGLMSDLEKTCSCCNDRGICREDLATNPDDPDWIRYCPNAWRLPTKQVTRQG